MKKLDMLRRVSRAARAKEVPLQFLREGGQQLWQCGPLRFAVPRHREIAEGTALAIFKDLEPELGEGWWR